ncbi:hypothetical protein OIU76_027582 [Salix suchowensis]|uniref:Uncharacterized protein n=1 Tax=Salix suchowensis TaxID=1278906 RepID=A0ABQ9APH2_9ROSI|nr:hypothetical protein OIU78_023348 [Salix suchowensis]KAJ6354799.1 hypothetical protein OIU77_005407 [Salix suchowensis]KAJ6373275.1 hypothetical protein OIU76_027582 [Salix suchowensis]
MTICSNKGKHDSTSRKQLSRNPDGYNITTKKSTNMLHFDTQKHSLGGSQMQPIHELVYDAGRYGILHFKKNKHLQENIKLVSPFLVDAYEEQKPETHFHSKQRS